MLDATVALMPSLQIRDIPEDVHRELKARAAKAGLSLSDYALDVLAERTKYPPIAEVLERAAKRDNSGVKPHDIVDIIRETRGPLPPRP
jgi:antitoxin FitA